MAWLAALVGQAGSPNPRLLEKLRLVPMLTVVTGAELLLLAVSLWFLHRRSAASWADRVPRLGSPQFGVWLLLGGWTAIAVLSLNFGVISLVNRLKQKGRSRLLNSLQPILVTTTASCVLYAKRHLKRPPSSSRPNGLCSFS